MIDETESLSRLIRANAETLATTVIDKLNALSTEKRASRKIYQDEQSRMALEISRVSRQLSSTGMGRGLLGWLLMGWSRWIHGWRM